MTEYLVSCPEDDAFEVEEALLKYHDTYRTPEGWSIQELPEDPTYGNTSVEIVARYA